VFILYLHLFCNNFRRGMSASWSLRDGPPLPLLCFNSVCGNLVATCTQDRRPWIWIYPSMGNSISKASLHISFLEWLCSQFYTVIQKRAVFFMSELQTFSLCYASPAVTQAINETCTQPRQTPHPRNPFGSC